MQYRREVDGLRALAVLPVIFFHAGFQTFSGGFVGVDIFFVISGYLITSIILAEKQAGTFSLTDFYERRARRILPALFAVMLACVPFAWFWLRPADMKDFSQSLVAVSGFASNILFWRTSGYFESSAELKPLLHTWSLAVEEQYYLFFPIFLMLAWRLGQKWIASSLAVFAIGSLAAAQWASTNSPAAAFYLFPTRGWELLIGSFIALYFSGTRGNQEISPLTREIGSAFGFLLITYSIFGFNRQTPFPSLYTLIPTIGAGLIILFATQQTFVGRLLGSKLFVGIGLISYSAYLWHQPLIAFSKHRSIDEPSKLLLASLAAAAMVLAYFTWKFVETPFRNKLGFSRKQIFSYGVVGSLLFSIAGLTGHFMKGFEGRLFADDRELLSFLEYSNKSTSYWAGDCFLLDVEDYTYFVKKCPSQQRVGGVLLWGDSHAQALANGLSRYRPGLVQYTASGCPPLKDVYISWRPKCKEVNDYVMKEIVRLRPREIYLHAYWASYKDENPEDNLRKTIDFIKSASPASTIIIVGGVPLWRPSLPEYMLSKSIALDDEHYLRNTFSNDVILSDRLLNNVAHATGVRFFSPMNTLCSDQGCKATTAFQGIVMPTAWDYGHLTAGGSILVARELVPQYPRNVSASTQHPM